LPGKERNASFVDSKMLRATKRFFIKKTKNNNKGRGEGKEIEGVIKTSQEECAGI